MAETSTDATALKREKLLREMFQDAYDLSLRLRSLKRVPTVRMRISARAVNVGLEKYLRRQLRWYASRLVNRLADSTTTSGGMRLAFIPDAVYDFASESKRKRPSLTVTLPSEQLLEVLMKALEKESQR